MFSGRSQNVLLISLGYPGGSGGSGKSGWFGGPDDEPAWLRGLVWLLLSVSRLF